MRLERLASPEPAEGEPVADETADGTPVPGFVAALGDLVGRLTGPGAARPAERPAPPDAATLAAIEQVQARIAAGSAPVGLLRLAEAIAAAEAAETAAAQAPAPAPREAPDEVLTDVVAAARGASFLVLEEHGPEEIAAAVTALAEAGLRIVVTAADAGLLEAVPTTVAGPPGLTAAEQRELRLLLATATPARRARAGRPVPPADALPTVAEIRALCTHAAGPVRRDGRGPGLLKNVLTTLDGRRLAAVVAVARDTRAALEALPGGTWHRPLVADLVHTLHRPTFDALTAAAIRALTVADESAGLPAVEILGPLPPHALEVLAEFEAYLASGGRVRRRFAGTSQRDVAPVLEAVRVEGAVPADLRSVRAVARQVELAEVLTAVDTACGALGVPAPESVGDLRILVGGLAAVENAVGQVGRLRHDVLFLHPSSPIAVPDLAAAEEITAGILDVAEHGSAAEAAARLAGLAEALAGPGPVEALVIEHREAVEALRARDPERYELARQALVPARREAADQERCETLLARLRAADAGLARAWAAGEHGFVWAAPLAALLTRLPAADQLDAVVVLDAAEVAADRMLIAAAAPRLLAVAGPGARPAEAGRTLLGALEGAAVPVVAPPRRPDPEGRVVRLPTARRQLPPQQAGA